MSAGPVFTALVLAGSRPGGVDPVAAMAGVRYKCMAPIGGRPMVERVLAVLAASSRIGQIVLVADPDCGAAGLPLAAELMAEGRLRIVPPAQTPATSVLAALDGIAHRPVLVTTADHALLDEAILHQFLSGAIASEADVAAGLASAEVILRDYPDTRRTFWKFRDGRFSGANLFALTTTSADAAVAFWRRVEAERKRPWRIVRLFGIGSLLLYLGRRLTLEGAFRRASATIGARVRPVVIGIAEAAIDVDKPSDVVLVEEILKRREAA